MTPEALARVEAIRQKHGPYKCQGYGPGNEGNDCEGCILLAALTPAPKCVGMEDCAEPPRYCEDCKNHGIITAMALANVATPPPPEPEGETHTETIRRLEGEVALWKDRTETWTQTTITARAEALAEKQRAEAAEGRLKQVRDVAKQAYDLTMHGCDGCGCRCCGLVEEILAATGEGEG